MRGTCTWVNRRASNENSARNKKNRSTLLMTCSKRQVTQFVLLLSLAILLAADLMMLFQNKPATKVPSNWSVHCTWATGRRSSYLNNKSGETSRHLDSTPGCSPKQPQSQTQMGYHRLNHAGETRQHQGSVCFKAGLSVRNQQPICTTVDGLVPGFDVAVTVYLRALENP